MQQTAPSARTKVRRVPKRGAYDRATIDPILDEALIGHIAFVYDGQPFCMPTMHARVGDTIYLHGSSKARWAHVDEACFTATLADGIVLARSAFHHSMNFRSVVVMGRLRSVELPDEKMAALEAFTERLMPGRWDEVRWPNRKELKATAVLAMKLDEASAKVRAGGAVDDEEDYALPVWAGVLPLTTTVGAPIADERLPAGTPVPAYVDGWSPSSRGSSSSATTPSTDAGANGATSCAARAA